MADILAYPSSLTPVAGLDPAVPQWWVDNTIYTPQFSASAVVIRYSADPADAVTQSHTFEIAKDSYEIAFVIECAAGLLSDGWGFYNNIPIDIVTANADLELLYTGSGGTRSFAFTADGTYIGHAGGWLYNVGLGTAGRLNISYDGFDSGSYGPSSYDEMQYIAVVINNLAAHSSSSITIEFPAGTAMDSGMSEILPTLVRCELDFECRFKALNKADWDIYDNLISRDSQYIELGNYVGDYNAEYTDQYNAYRVYETGRVIHNPDVFTEPVPTPMDGYNSLYSSSLTHFTLKVGIDEPLYRDTGLHELVVFRGQEAPDGLHLDQFAYVDLYVDVSTDTEWMELGYWVEGVGYTAVNSTSFVYPSSYPDYAILEITSDLDGLVSVALGNEEAGDTLITLQGTIPTATIPAQADRVGFACYADGTGAHFGGGTQSLEDLYIKLSPLTLEEFSFAPTTITASISTSFTQTASFNVVSVKTLSPTSLSFSVSFVHTGFMSNVFRTLYLQNTSFRALDASFVVDAALTASRLSQEVYRFRRNDGNESTASWIEPENTDVYLPLSENIRVRFGLQNVFPSTLNDETIRAEYRINDGAWSPLTEESNGASVEQLFGEFTAANDDIFASFICENGTLLVAYSDGAIPSQNYIAASTDNGQTFTTTVINMPAGPYDAPDYIEFKSAVFGEYTSPSHIGFCVVLRAADDAGIEDSVDALYVYWSTDSGASWSSSGTEIMGWGPHNPEPPVWHSNGSEVYVVYPLTNKHNIAHFDGNNWSYNFLSYNAGYDIAEGIHGRFAEAGEGFDFIAYHRYPIRDANDVIIGSAISAYEVTNMSTTDEYSVMLQGESTALTSDARGSPRSLKVIKLDDGYWYIVASEAWYTVDPGETPRPVIMYRMVTPQFTDIQYYDAQDIAPVLQTDLQVTQRFDRKVKILTQGGWILYDLQQDSWDFSNHSTYIDAEENTIWQHMRPEGYFIMLYSLDASTQLGYLYYNPTSVSEGSDTTQQIINGSYVADNNGFSNFGVCKVPSFPSNDVLEVEYWLQVHRNELAPSDEISIRSDVSTFNDGLEAVILLPWLGASVDAAFGLEATLTNPQTHSLQTTLIGSGWLYATPALDGFLSDSTFEFTVSADMVFESLGGIASLDWSLAVVPSLLREATIQAQLGTSLDVFEVTTIEVWLKAQISTALDTAHTLSRDRGVWGTLGAQFEADAAPTATLVVSTAMSVEAQVAEALSSLYVLTDTYNAQFAASSELVARRRLKALCAVLLDTSAKLEVGIEPEASLSYQFSTQNTPVVERGIQASVSFSGTLVAVDSSTRLVSARLRPVVYLTPQLSAGEYCLQAVQSLHKVTVGRAPLVQNQRLNTVVSHPRKVVEVKAVQEIQTVIVED